METPHKPSNDAGEGTRAGHTGAGITLAIDCEHGFQKLFYSLLLCEVFLVVADYFIHFQDYVTEIGALKRVFNLAREDSLGNWFGAAQLLVVALTLWLVYAAVRQTPVTSWRKISWALLAIFFTYMAFDDGARLHERLATAAKEFLDDSALIEAYPSYPWQVVFAPLFVAGTLLLLDIFRRGLSGRASRLMLGSGLALYIAAVGLDVLEGVPEYGPAGALDILSDEGSYAVRHYVKVTEEFLELLGGTCFLIAFLRHLAQTAPDLRFRFK
jgi:hypothetical protein